MEIQPQKGPRSMSNKPGSTLVLPGPPKAKCDKHVIEEDVTMGKKQVSKH